jgi:hypothetical protein
LPLEAALLLEEAIVKDPALVHACGEAGAFFGRQLFGCNVLNAIFRTSLHQFRFHLLDVLNLENSSGYVLFF